MSRDIIILIAFLFYLVGVFVVLHIMFKEEYNNNIKDGMDEETARKEANNFMKYYLHTDDAIFSWLVIIIPFIFCTIPSYLYRLYKTKIKKH